MGLPACPKCQSNYTYEDGHLFVCPMCFHSWDQMAQAAAEEALITRDINGNILEDGDDVIIAQDLKLGKDTIKQGTKVKGLRILNEPYNGHDIQGRIDGFGTLYLKSSVVKK